MAQPSNKKFEPGEEETHFYKELDEKKSHQSCCTCQTLALLMAVILLIFASGIFYLYWQITRHKAFPQNLSKITSISDFNNKISSLKPDINNKVTIPVTQEELTFLLAEGFSAEGLILKEIQVSINPSHVLIYGTLTKPLSSKVIITAVPEVKNGRVEFNVINTSAGNINFPTFLNKKISQSFGDFLATKLSFIYQKMTVEQAVLQDGKIIITGKINK